LAPSSEPCIRSAGYNGGYDIGPGFFRFLETPHALDYLSIVKQNPKPAFLSIMASRNLADKVDTDIKIAEVFSIRPRHADLRSIRLRALPPRFSSEQAGSLQE
jgi:hypothetical protein